MIQRRRRWIVREVAGEFLGTFWLIFGGCGSAVLGGLQGDTGIGIIGISMAFGFTLLTAVYAFGHWSGVHLNPAVTIGLWIAGRFDSGKIGYYILSQLSGAVLAAFVLFVMVRGNGGNTGSFAANGYGMHSPGGFDVTAAFLMEFLMTLMFMLVILGVTDERARRGFAGITIGLALALIHIAGMPVTNTSVNPARSISQALFAETWALKQLWLFIVAPVSGAVLAALFYRFLSQEAD